MYYQRLTLFVSFVFVFVGVFTLIIDFSKLSVTHNVYLTSVRISFFLLVFSVERRAWLCCDRKLPFVQPITTGEIQKDWRWLRRSPSRVSLASTQPVATLALSLSLLASLLTSRLDVWNHWGSSCHLTTIRNGLAAGERWSRTLTGCYCRRCLTSVCCVGRHRLTWLQVRQVTAVTVPSSSG